MTSRGFQFSIVSVFFAALSCQVLAQGPSTAPALKPGEKADLLLAYVKLSDLFNSAEPSKETAIEPIAFFVNGEVRDCYRHTKDPKEAPLLPHVENYLKSFYQSQRTLSILQGGTKVGSVQLPTTCSFEPGLELLGCVDQVKSGTDSSQPLATRGLVWTGSPLNATHASLHQKANTTERLRFLEAASKELTIHHVRAAPNTLHHGTIWRIQLASGHAALAGSVLVQLAADKPLTYYSYRMFAIFEEQDDTLKPVLDSYRRATAYIDDQDHKPKIGEVVSEEAQIDDEQFVDSIPLFPNEPDIVISRHSYYEDWNYSIFRWNGTAYKQIYTGCGGGD